MIKSSCIILSIWSVLNIIASLVVVLLPVIFSDGTAPALVENISPNNVAEINNNILLNANSIAVFANMLNISCSISILYIVWTGLINAKKSALITLFIILSIILFAGIAADYVSTNYHPMVNMISAVILYGGLFLALPGVIKHD